MKSIALWYELDSDIQKEQASNNQEAELHFNLWKLPRKNRRGLFDRFLDIGIKIKTPFELSKVCLFLPQIQLNGQDKQSFISDLGYTMTANRNLLNTVFNDFLSCSWNGKDPLYKVNNVSNQKDEPFYIYPIDINRNTQIIADKSELGSIIKIDLPNKELRAKGIIYLRFRIVINDHFISAVENLSFSFLESSFFQTEIIDFRLNDIRDLDNKFLEENQLNKLESFFHLNKVHFFFMCDSKEDNIYSNSLQNNCRILEWDKWRDYIPINFKNNKNEILAYHWKTKTRNIELPPKNRFCFGQKSKYKFNKEIKTDFSILIKTKFSSFNWIHIIYYIWGAIIIGCLINLIYNLIFDSITWSNFNMLYFSILLVAIPIVLFFLEILKIIIKTTKFTIRVSKKFVNYIRHYI